MHERGISLCVCACVRFWGCAREFSVCVYVHSMTEDGHHFVLCNSLLPMTIQCLDFIITLSTLLSGTDIYASVCDFSDYLLCYTLHVC